MRDIIGYTIYPRGKGSTIVTSNENYGPGTELTDGEKDELARVRAEFPQVFTSVPEADIFRYGIEWTWEHTYDGKQWLHHRWVSDVFHHSEEDANSWGMTELPNLTRTSPGNWSYRVVCYMRYPF